LKELEEENFDILYAGMVLDPAERMTDLLEEIEEYYEPLVLYLHSDIKKNKKDTSDLKAKARSLEKLEAVVW